MVMAHELVHTMGAAHDGEGGNQDCDGEYQRRICAQKRPKVCPKPGTGKSLNFFDKVLVASWVPCIFLEPQNGQPAVKGVNPPLNNPISPNLLSRSLARFVNSHASGCLRDDSPPTWADRQSHIYRYLIVLHYLDKSPSPILHPLPLANKINPIDCMNVV